MTTTTKPMNGVAAEKPTGIVATLSELPVVGKFAVPARDAAFNFVTEYRGYFVLIFVLPLSILFDLWFRMRAKWVQLRNSAPKDHDNRVAKISKHLKELHASGHRGQLVTARGGWQSTTIGNRPYKDHAVKVSLPLHDVLEIDLNAMTVRCEPYVSMGQVSEHLAPHNLRIPVTPELDDLTVGGLMMGVGIETSSHLFGLFDDCVVACEIVLADGTVKNCSATENTELFDALPWSYGTLGFLLSATIKVIPSKPFVRIEYIPCHTRKAGIDTLKKYSAAEDDADLPDFIESLQYSSDTSVVMPASLVDADQVPWLQRNDISMWYKPWYYKHVETFLDLPRSGTYVEYIPTRAYFHRHTRSIFWEMADIIPFGNTVFFRYLLGWTLPIKVSFLKITQTPAIKKMYEEQHVVQDMLVPFHALDESLTAFHDTCEIYPLWLCPYKAIDQTRANGTPHRHFLRKPPTQDLEPGKNFALMVDIGAYGVPQQVRDKQPYDNRKGLRELEKFVLNKKGFQMMYADSFLSRAEFREMFDHAHYDKMKKKFDPNGSFPEIFDKTCRQGMATFIDRAKLVKDSDAAAKKVL